MFQNSSIFVLAGGINDNEVFRIDIDSDTQASISKSFSDAVAQLTSGKERIAFDGSYKPDENEYLFIENYQISDDIRNAIRDPFKGLERSNISPKNTLICFLTIIHSLDKRRMA